MVLEIEKVFSLFRLFYDEPDADGFLPVVTLSAERISHRILCEEDFGSIAVHYLAAAEALCRALEIKSVRERLALTKTGAVPQEQVWSARLEYARQLYGEYEKICAPMLRDDDFVFVQVG